MSVFTILFERIDRPDEPLRNLRWVCPLCLEQTPALRNSMGITDLIELEVLVKTHLVVEHKAKLRSLPRQITIHDVTHWGAKPHAEFTT